MNSGSERLTWLSGGAAHGSQPATLGTWMRQGPQKPHVSPSSPSLWVHIRARAVPASMPRLPGCLCLCVWTPRANLGPYLASPCCDPAHLHTQEPGPPQSTSLSVPQAGSPSSTGQAVALVMRAHKATARLWRSDRTCTWSHSWRGVCPWRGSHFYRTRWTWTLTLTSGS